MCSVAEAISSPLVLICCVVAEKPAAEPLRVPALVWIWLTTMRNCSSIVWKASARVASSRSPPV